MKVHVANYYESSRLSAIAGEAMPVGAVCKITNNGGVRTLLKLLDGDTITPGKYCVALKVSADPYQVDSTTVPTFTGDRTVSISTGDAVVAVTKAIIEFDASVVHASLDPARGGTLPAPLDVLAVKGGLLCTAATAGANVTGQVFTCYEVLGTKIRVEMIDQIA